MRIGALAALAALAVLAPSASAQLKTKEAYFKVTVEGVQTTTWTANHEPAFRCDSRYSGSGSERVTFKSRRAVKLRAFRLGRGPVIWLRGKGIGVLPAKGSVRRSGTLDHSPPLPECAVGDGDGSGERPKPDCGTKRIPSLPLQVMHDPLKPDRITVSRNDHGGPSFQQCPMMGEGWPTILSKDDRHRTAGEEFPRKDVFDRRQGKVIVLGKGTVRGGSQGTKYTTKIRWELTFTRVRG